MEPRHSAKHVQSFACTDDTRLSPILKDSGVLSDALDFNVHWTARSRYRQGYYDLEKMLDDTCGQIRDGVMDGWGEIIDVSDQPTDTCIVKHVVYDVAAPEEEEEDEEPVDPETAPDDTCDGACAPDPEIVEREPVIAPPIVAEPVVEPFLWPTAVQARNSLRQCT